MKRLKILISAHELSPFLGSECAIGWNIVQRLAKYHDITAIYAETNQSGTNNYQKNISSFIAENGQIEGLKFISVTQPSVNKIASKINRLISGNAAIGFPPLYHFIYRQWQKKVSKLVGKMIVNEKFDIIHHLTSINFREPGYLWKFNIPFIWGPTGGTSILVDDFYNYLTFKNKIFEGIRNLSIMYLLRFSSKIRNAIRNSKMIYAFSYEDKEYFNAFSKEKVKILLDTGTYSSLGKSSIKRNDQKLRGLWCGQLVARKAPDILLKVLSGEPLLTAGIIVSIVPSGPLPNEIVELAERLNVHNIEWFPGANREKLFEIMTESDFLIHTSYREATSAIIPEALSIGLPIICHDISGMSVAVTENCGIKIPLISPDKSIQGFREAILYLFNNPKELEKLKSGAIERAKELSWDSIAEKIAGDYLDVLSDISYKTQ
jgi:glycosyltransferase involved in cell wall biosynthesis